uniref:hypothetical protein n=1 Tax=Flavobacterium sp. TaxID=239 RepID=UPI00404B2254
MFGRLELKANYETVYGESLGERDEYKKLMMTNLFTANGYNPKGKQLFTTTYPFVSSVFKKIKKSDRKRLSKVLQQLESKLVLRVICKEISQHNKHIPLLTIHDSILTTPEHWETVHRITRDVLLREVGFTPELHITRHDQF